MTYGLFDTQDQVWMGTTEGPFLETDPQVARLSAEVIADRLGWPVTRVQARPFTSVSKMRDEVEPIRTAEESLDRLEKGAV